MISDISFKNYIGKRVIKINQMYPIIIFGEEDYLTIECPWRLRDKKSILLGKGEFDGEKTHEDASRRFSELLIGRAVVDIRITSNISDLAIHFDNGLLLELFTDSGIYEGWTLNGNNDFLLVALPGGRQCFFGGSCPNE